MAVKLPSVQMLAGRVHGFFELHGDVVRHLGVEPSLAFGTLDGLPSPAAELLATCLQSARIGFTRPEDMRRSLWEKFLLASSIGGVGAALAALTEYDFTYKGMERIVIALTNEGHVPDPAMVQYRLELSCLPPQNAAFGATMKALKLRHGLWIEDEEIATVKHRTLVINGKDDKIVPGAHAFKYLELLENSTGVILPHCGHWAMIEHPTIFSNTVLQFLNDRL